MVLATFQAHLNGTIDKFFFACQVTMRGRWLLFRRETADKRGNTEM